MLMSIFINKFLRVQRDEKIGKGEGGRGEGGGGGGGRKGEGGRGIFPPLLSQVKQYHYSSAVGSLRVLTFKMFVCKRLNVSHHVYIQTINMLAFNF